MTTTQDYPHVEELTTSSARNPETELDIENEKGVIEEDEPARPDPPFLGPPPDGGLTAWLTIAGAFLASFVQFGMSNAFGVFQGYYETHQLREYRKDVISWIGSIQLCILFAGGVFSGRIFDAVGAHALLIPGSVAFVLSLMLTSLCKEFYQFLLCQGILFGIASALIFNVVVSVPSHWFARRRAFAIAVAMTGSGLGGTLWPIAIQRMLDSLGFEWTLRVCGFISLGLLAAGNALIRTRLPRKKPAPFTNFFAPFSEPRFAFFVIGGSISCFGLFTAFFYLPLNARRLGAAASLASYTVSFLNAGSTVGRLAAGLGDRVGRFNLSVAAQYTGSILLLAMWIPLNNVAALVAFAVLYGFAVGIIVALVPACISQISEPHEIGARVGLNYAGVGLFMLAGPPINGVILDKYPGAQGFRYSGLFSGLSCLVGATCVLVSRLSIDRKLWAAV